MSDINASKQQKYFLQQIILLLLKAKCWFAGVSRFLSGFRISHDKYRVIFNQ